jgi:hypothetical protein
MTGRIVCVGLVLLAVVATTVSLALGGKAEPSSSDDPAWAVANNYGRVTLVYPDPGGVYFQLLGGKTAMQPKDGYYYLPISHPNYQAMCDLLYRAAEKRWKLYVNTEPKLDAKRHAIAYSFVVNLTE